jgi:prepilin-type N-terminal cleavage/methylation domain-containing protein
MIFSAHPTGVRRVLRAFTLIELLTVLAIIAVLAGLVIGAARRGSESGRIARAKAELAALSAALESYRRTYGDYPQTDDGARLLQSLLGQRGPTGAPLQDRAFIELVRFSTNSVADPTLDSTVALIDPWGRPYLYIYKVPPDGWINPSFVLYSLGADGLDTPGMIGGRDADPLSPGNADNIYANRW